MKLKSYLRGLGTGIFVSTVLMGIAVSGRKASLSDDEIKTRAKALGMVEENDVLVKPAEGEQVNGDKSAEPETEAKPVVKPEEKSKDGTPAPVVKSEAKAESKPEEKTDSKPEDKTDTKPEDNQDTEQQEAAKEKTQEPDGNKNDTEAAAPVENKEKDVADDSIRDSKEDRAMGGQKEEKSSNEKVTGLKNSSDDLGYNEYFTIQIAGGSSSETVSRLLKSGGAVEDADDFDNFLCKNHYDKKITPGVFKIPVGADYEQIAEIITGK